MRTLEFALYKQFMHLPGPVRKLGARMAYNALSFTIERALPKRRHGYELAKDVQAINSAYMNYGYLDTAFEAEPLDVPPIIETSRMSIQLYHRVATQAELAGKDVLEVGCGRGGGASWIAGLGPRRMVGVDLSPMAIEFCRRAHVRDNLEFLVGDAGALPFADRSFDVVVNVESSHCYPSMDRFLSEVRRVLRPGGVFAWTDARFDDQLVELEQAFARSGLTLVDQRDISGNVVAALDKAAPTRLPHIEATVPAPLRSLVRSTLAMPGTMVYDALTTGRLRYLCKLLRRPEDDGTRPGAASERGAGDRGAPGPGSGRQQRRQQRSRAWVVRYLRGRSGWRC